MLEMVYKGEQNSYLFHYEEPENRNKKKEESDTKVSSVSAETSTGVCVLSGLPFVVKHNRFI
jgi:hypothetical protein